MNNNEQQIVSVATAETVTKTAPQTLTGDTTGVAECQLPTSDTADHESALRVEAVTVNASESKGAALLEQLAGIIRRHVILSETAADALALWVVHTYAFQLRDVTAYIGVQSPEKGCGKSTLLSVLGKLCNRSVLASNISASAFFRVISETVPTLLIDEADTSLHGNDELRGILNSGYKRDTAFVIRVANEAGCRGADRLISGYVDKEAQNTTLRKYATWCPKAIAAIGQLPETLADRCILVQMQKKSTAEVCARLRDLEPAPVRSECADFVVANSSAIGTARPEMPAELSDRAAEIWEPLIVIADLAGGEWPMRARRAAVALATAASESSPIGALLLDIFYHFLATSQERLFSRSILAYLSRLTDRAWQSLRGANNLDEPWLATQLRPYGIRPKQFRIGGEVRRGYCQAEIQDACRRYVPRPQVDAFKREMLQIVEEDEERKL